MTHSTSPLPCAVPVAADTGIIPQASAHYQKRLSDLRGLFMDSEALERRIREENDPICYENYAFNESKNEGDLFFGTTIIYPGKVGFEYHLTRGRCPQVFPGVARFRCWHSGRRLHWRLARRSRRLRQMAHDLLLDLRLWKHTQYVGQ